MLFGRVWRLACSFLRVMLPTTIETSQRDILLLEYLPQVQHVARRIHSRLPPHVLREDLVHAGILGLMDAARKFEPSKNVKLKHYAEIRIRGAILDSLRLLDWGPRRLRRQGRRLEQATLRCKSKLGHEPDESEIAAEMQLSLKNLQRLVGELRGLEVASLQSGANPYGEEGMEGSVESNGENPYEQALRSEMTTLLETAIAELPGRDRKVLSLYHFQELTMKEVGAIMHIGQARVSQIHSAAMARLRVQLSTALVPPRSKTGLELALPLAHRESPVGMSLSKGP
jgi:RNA polymerase sigma factor for flagellar operon FliA